MNSEAAKSWIFRSILLLAVALAGVWIANNTYWDDIVVRAPLKGEAATNPQYAVRTFLESLGIRVESHQSLTTLPPANGVMVINLWHWDLIESRRRRIEEWVRAGGRLIVDDTLIGSIAAFPEFTGIKQEFPPVTNDEDDDEDADSDGADEEAEDESDNEDQEPNALSALVEDGDQRCVRWDVAIDTQGASRGRDSYSLCSLRTFGWLVSDKNPAWALRDEDGLQAIRVPVDKGYVTVINATPFQNRAFRDIDHGAFLVAATKLRHGDVVWLLTEADHPSILTLIWRYGAPVVVFFFLFVAAVLWRNALRFGPLRASASAPRRSLAEQIRGTGWFILRLGGARTLYSAMVRAVKEAARRRIIHFDRLTTEQQLAALVLHTGMDSEALKQAIYAAPGETRQHLYRAIATLETARRALVLDNHFVESTTPSKAQEAPHAN